MTYSAPGVHLLRALWSLFRWYLGYLKGSGGCSVSTQPSRQLGAGVHADAQVAGILYSPTPPSVVRFFLPGSSSVTIVMLCGDWPGCSCVGNYDAEGSQVSPRSPIGQLPRSVPQVVEAKRQSKAYSKPKALVFVYQFCLGISFLLLGPFGLPPWLRDFCWKKKLLAYSILLVTRSALCCLNMVQAHGIRGRAISHVLNPSSSHSTRCLPPLTLQKGSRLRER